MPEETTTTPVETESQAKPVAAKSNKGLIVGGLIVGGLVLVTIVAVAIAAMTGAFNGLFNMGGKSAIFDASQPQQAVSNLNQATISLVEELQNKASTTDKLSTDEFVGLLSKYGLEASAFEINVETAGDPQNTVVFNFDGGSQIVNSKLAMEGTGKLSGKIAGMGDITANIDLVVLNDQLYFRIRDIPQGVLQGDAQFLAFLTDKWLKVNLAEAGALSSGVSGVDLTDINSVENKAELDALKKNPPFSNGRAVADRQVAGQTLKCMLVDVKDTDSSEVTPLELCSAAGGKLPMFVGAQETDSKGVTTKVNFVSKQQQGTLNIVAPEGAIDIQELFGGF